MPQINDEIVTPHTRNNDAVLDEWAQYWALPPIENE